MSDLLRDFPSVELLYVFGSQVSGRAESGSDIDVAVLLDEHSSDRDPFVTSLPSTVGRRSSRSTIGAVLGKVYGGVSADAVDGNVRDIGGMPSLLPTPRTASQTPPILTIP